MIQSTKLTIKHETPTCLSWTTSPTWRIVMPISFRKANSIFNTMMCRIALTTTSTRWSGSKTVNKWTKKLASSRATAKIFRRACTLRQLRQSICTSKQSTEPDQLIKRIQWCWTWQTWSRETSSTIEELHFVTHEFEGFHPSKISEHIIVVFNYTFGLNKRIKLINQIYKYTKK